MEKKKSNRAFYDVKLKREKKPGKWINKKIGKNGRENCQKAKWQKI